MEARNCIEFAKKNPFWKDVITAFTDFSRIYDPETPQILSDNLWFSDYTEFNCSKFAPAAPRADRGPTSRATPSNRSPTEYGHHIGLACANLRLAALPF